MRRTALHRSEGSTATSRRGAWIVFSKAVTEELPERDQYTALKVAVMVSTQHIWWTSTFVAVDGPRYSRSSLALGVALWIPRSRWLLDWWREQQTA